MTDRLILTEGDGIAAIIPAYNSARTLAVCLDAIGKGSCKPQEIWVFDDASNDDTASIALKAGAKLIQSPGGKTLGPAAGRSIVANMTAMPVLLFIDSDVEVHEDAIATLAQALEKNPETVAAFGSYDNRPACHRHAATYANLRHHHFHQISPPDAMTFWTGFGAIRRDVFIAINGFDQNFRTPSIEDIELGTRVAALGKKIRLVPAAQAKHYKDWTLLELWKTDVFQRALPWSKLLCNGKIDRQALNTCTEEKINVLTAHAIWVSAICWSAEMLPLYALTAIACFYAFMNRKIYALFWHRGGPLFVASGILLHWFYHIYASITFMTVKVMHSVRSWTMVSRKTVTDLIQHD